VFYWSGGGGNGDGDNGRLGGLKVEFRKIGGFLRCLLAFVPMAGRIQSEGTGVDQSMYFQSSMHDHVMMTDGTEKAVAHLLKNVRIVTYIITCSNGYNPPLYIQYLKTVLRFDRYWKLTSSNPLKDSQSKEGRESNHYERKYCLSTVAYREQS